MNTDEILAIANNPATPVLRFGSPELDAWNRTHKGGTSGWYVVVHTTPHLRDSPYFRILSRWFYGDRAPIAYEVPQATQAAA